MNEPQKIAHRLMSLGRDQAKVALVAYAGLIKNADEAMGKNGWRRVDLPLGTLLHDGQPVQWVGRKSFLMPKETFDQMRAEEIEKAKREAVEKKPRAKPGESLTSVLCPSCQSVMAKQPVCPNCSKGRAGFKILCQCTECSHEVYL